MNSLFYFYTPSYGWVCLLFVRSSVPYVFSLSVTYVQKKDIALQRCLLWVPGGTRTHDIQNHNLTL